MINIFLMPHNSLLVFIYTRVTTLLNQIKIKKLLVTIRKPLSINQKQTDGTAMGRGVVVSGDCWRSSSSKASFLTAF